MLVKKAKFGNRSLIISTSISLGVLLMAGAATAADPITVVSWGGTYGEAQDKALFNDASKNSGIEIIRESGASMSKTCLQVESGAVTWDLVVTGSGGSASAAANGCLEKIDYDVVDVSNFYPNTYTDYCVGSDVFATVMSWNTEKYGEPGSDGYQPTKYTKFLLPPKQWNAPLIKFAS